MQMKKEFYNSYINILKEELIPAFGCTEPIAIAYAGAKAREVLGGFPDKVIIQCSGNIIKNVKGVIVPKTKDLRGISASVLMGVVGGNSELGLEVLSECSESNLKKVRELLKTDICEEELLDTPAKLHIIVKMFSGNNSSLVEIVHSHLNIVKVLKNEKILMDKHFNPLQENSNTIDRGCLNIKDIIDFSNNVDIESIRDIIEKQIEYNSLIAQEGLNQKYGANVGTTILKFNSDSVKIRAKAVTAAGSDARMSGCEMPVVINSGSGNQGMTVSLPVIEYAKELKVTHEQLLRSLCLSNLIAIEQKSKIGRLSAYCGVVSAATGAGAGIAYMHGADYQEICQTITNILGNISGIVCDGAKPSCAAKIASSVDAAVLGFELAKKGDGFGKGEGIVGDTAESTINNVARMAKDGMKSTDEEILKIMVGD